MQRRSWWIEIQPVHTLFNFKWQPSSSGINYNRLGASGQPFQHQNSGDKGAGNSFGPP